MSSTNPVAADQSHRQSGDGRIKGVPILGSVILVAALTIPCLSMRAQEIKRITDDPGNETPTFIEGSVKLQNGVPIQYTYHFDHSAVRRCVRAGSSLIMLIESGNLVRFDAESLRMTGQQIVRGRATAITVDDRDHVLIGTEDGKISEVNPATLEQTTVATAKGKIVWLAAVQSPKGLGRMIVATVSAGDADEVIPWPGETYEHIRARSPNRKPPRWSVPDFSIVVYVNGSERSFRLPRRGGVPRLLEGSGRLWLGADAGEWGGACGYLDLRTGKERTIREKMPGVIGFLRTQDGRMLVYGGTNHMMDHGFVASIEGDRLKYIREFKAQLEPPAKQGLISLPETDRQSPIPQGTLDLITPDLEGKGFWVLSQNILYHANASFSEWAPPVDLDYGWDKGRIYFSADAHAKWLILDKSRPREMVILMARGGFVRISQGQPQPHPSTGQLGAWHINDVWDTSIATLFVEKNTVGSSWLLAGARWEEFRFCPGSIRSEIFLRDLVVEPFGDDGSGIVSFCSMGDGPPFCSIVNMSSPGSADFKEIWKDFIDCRPDEPAVIMTSDHEMLRISHKKVRIHDGVGWREAGQNTVPVRADSSTSFVPSRGRRFIHLERVGQAEFFFDVELGNIDRLTKKPDGTFEFGVMDDTNPALPGSVFDVVADGPGWFLAATGPGLIRFRPESGERRSIPSPKDSEEIISLCRDGQGRLWAASNDRAYLSSDEGTHWEPLDLPMLSYVDKVLIRPNPQKQNGIVLTISDRGVVFLEW